jgi:hypothetical protein
VPAHVAASFYALFPGLADGGLYVIEDVQTAFWPRLGGSLIDGGATMKLALSVLEFLNHAEIKAENPTQQIAAFANEVRSLRAYHNLIVVEKGDNSEPSNFDYRLENPHAARAVRLIEQGLARTPTPEGFANLVEMLTRAKGFAEAEALVTDALAKWPDHPALLLAAINLATARGDMRAKLGYLERQLKLEPDNASIQRFCEETRSKLPSPAA